MDRCGDSPIRKPPRFGKRFIDSDSPIRVKESDPCFKRMSTRSENEVRNKPVSTNDSKDLLEILFAEWMKDKLQSNYNKRK